VANIVSLNCDNYSRDVTEESSFRERIRNVILKLSMKNKLRMNNNWKLRQRMKAERDGLF
jgi:hypothetical protein